MRIPFSGRSKYEWIAAFLLLCCGLFSSRARAEVAIPGLELDPGNGIDIKITSPFKQLPQSGFATLQIYIHNTSGQARTWSFKFVSSTYPSPSFGSSREFTVQNNAEQTFEVLVPLSTNTNNSYAMNNVRISASGYGVTRGDAYFNTNSSSGGGHSLTDFVLMSQALGVRSWGPLEKACTDKGTTLLGCDFDPNYLPTDWRGYLGVDSMWITDTEWQITLDPVLRNAIKEWVLQGGKLMICTTGTHQTSDFGFRETGYGQVQIVEWDGKELNAGKILPQIVARGHSITSQLCDGYQTKWDLMAAIGNLKFNGGFIMIFVTCFGLVIGPMNLFWFAKSGRRHRLFWTTPLISLAGSLLLALVIILQDGFGGIGNRMVLVQLIPGENEAVIAQEQVSRTGLLLSTHFDTEDKIFMSPIGNLPALSGMTHGISIKSGHGNYTEDGDSYGGDWFISRSVQAHLLEVIRPSRSRIEIIPVADDTAPTLLSSVETDLQQIFYIDDAGHYWQTGPIRVGEKKILQSASEADFDKWMDSNVREAGARIEYLLDLAKKRHGYFYAVANDPKADAVPTMLSIRWKNSKTIYLGPCAVQKNVAPQ